MLALVAAALDSKVTPSALEFTLIQPQPIPSVNNSRQRSQQTNPLHPPHHNVRSMSSVVPPDPALLETQVSLFSSTCIEEGARGIQGARPTLSSDCMSPLHLSLYRVPVNNSFGGGQQTSQDGEFFQLHIDYCLLVGLFNAVANFSLDGFVASLEGQS